MSEFMPQKPLIRDIADQAVAGADHLLMADRRATVAIPGRPVARSALALPAAVAALTQTLGQWGLNNAFELFKSIKDAAPLLRALVRPLIEQALQALASALLDQVVKPMEAELTKLAEAHPEVDLAGAHSALAAFYSITDKDTT